MKKQDGVRFGIGKKLILGVGTLIGISAIVGTLAILSMLSIQSNSMELSNQYLPEVLLVNEIERETLKAMYNTRGYWLSGENSYYEEAMKNLQALDKAMVEAQALLERSPKLAKLRENLPKAREFKATYVDLLGKTKEKTDLIAKDRTAMDVAAKAFGEAIVSYNDAQEASFQTEIRQGSRASALLLRQSKVAQSRDVADWFSEVRVGNFKTQAYRDPAFLKDSLPRFDRIQSTVSDLLKETVQQVNKDRLALVARTAEDYHQAVTAWLASNSALDDLAEQRRVAASSLGDLAEATSIAGATLSQQVANANSTIVGAANWTILTGLLISLLIGTVVALLLVRSITVPLGLVTSLADRVTRGDFSIEVHEVKSQDELGQLTASFYEMVEGLKLKATLIENIANGVLTDTIPLASEDDGLGRSLQRMQKGLNEILSQVNVAVDQMASGSDQVSTAAQSLSQGATEQASSLEEISASSNEIHGQSKQNAENALTANQLAKQASQSAEQGNLQMKDLMVLLEKMNKSSEDTKTIVKTIDDIAFQVNLLALNANVEAARAGKYGKGFAVVAEEVRSLAVRSAAAVSETNRMVEESIQSIQEVNVKALKTGEQLDGILANANKVADFLEEIAASSQEQAKALGQINGGLDQIDQVTQSNTASAEESASASEELSGQAQQLKAMVSRFKLSNSETPPVVQAKPASVSGKVPGPSLLKKAISASPSAPPKDILLSQDFDTF